MRRLVVLPIAVLAFFVGSGALAPQHASACVVTAPANITVGTTANQASAVVTYPAPLATGADCGVVTCTPASGSSYPVGVSVVRCSSSGDPGALGAFTITVVDTQPPTITAPANRTVATDPGQPTARVTLTPPVVSDNAPGVRSSCTQNSGDHFPIGSTTVTCTAFDAAGNSSTANFTVTVTDSEAPTLVVPEPITTAAGQPTAVRFAVGATDNSAKPVAASCSRASGSVFPVGATTVSCTATDGAGNVGRGAFVVTVSDQTKPYITRFAVTGRTIRFTLSETAMTTITIQRCARACRNLVRRKATNAAGARTTALVGVGGRRLGPGRYRVVVSAVDSAGNVSSTERLSIALR